MKNKIIIFLVGLCFFSSYSYAQCPPNLDFEFGNFVNWQCYTGNIGNSSPFTITLNPSAPTANRHVLISSSSTALDQYSGCPEMCPFPGPPAVNNYCLKLGNDLASYGAEAVRYTVHIPIGQNNFNTSFYYMAVLNDGGTSHDSLSQPHFKVNITDSATGNVLMCNSLSFFPGPGLGWQSAANDPLVKYVCWTPKVIGLSNLAGHTIYMDIVTTDCGYGGHFGYAYVDFSNVCGSSPITVGYCPGANSATLLAPTGYATYGWYESTTPGTIIGTGSVLSINPIPVPTPQYCVTLTPFPGQGCPDNQCVNLVTQPPPVAVIKAEPGFCVNQPKQFTDSSYTLASGTFISSWAWDFGDIPASVSLTNLNTSQQQNPTHIYHFPGTYTVRLIAGTNLNCISDTFFYTITNNAMTVGNDTLLCTSAPVTLNAVASGPVPNPPLPCGSSNTPCTAPTTHTVGTGNDATTDVTPFNNNYQNGRLLLRYTLADLTAAGGLAPVPQTIKSIAFNITTLNSYVPYNNFTISMECFPTAALMPGNFPTLTNVVYTNAAYSATLGWNTFVLNSTYDWDGASDILIEVCYSNFLFSGSDIVAKTAKAGVQVLWAVSTTSATPGCNLAYSSPNSVGQSTKLPNCRFATCVIPLNAGYNYYWTSNPASATPYPNAASITVTPTVNTTYYCTLMGTFVCPAVDSAIVKVIGGVQMNLPNDTAVCKGVNIPLTISTSPSFSNATYNWISIKGNTIGNATSTNTYCTINASDTIICELTTSGCVVRDTFYVRLLQTPTANFSVVTPICFQDSSSIQYTGNAGVNATFAWNIGTGVSSPLISNTSGGVYRVTWATSGLKNISLIVTDSGCVSLPVVNTVNVLPKLSSVFSKLNPLPQCQGDTLYLQYNGNGIGLGAVGNWTFPVGSVFNSNTMINNTVKVVLPSGMNHFSLQTNYPTSPNCPSTITMDSIYIYVSPTDNFTSTPTHICSGSTITYLHTGSTDPNNPNPVSYLWNFGPGSTILSGAGTNNPVVQFVNNGASAQINTVSLQLFQGICSSGTPFTVTDTIHIIPIANINANSNILCAGSYALINTNGSVIENTNSPTYTWTWQSPTFVAPSTGAGPGPHTLVYNNIGTTLVDTVFLTISEYGCTSKPDTLVMTSYPVPQPMIAINWPNPSTPQLCAGDAISFTNNSIPNPIGSSPIYIWNAGGGSPNTSTYGANFTTTYLNPTSSQIVYFPTLTMQQDGCMAVLNINTPIGIPVNPLPVPVITGDADLCVNDSTELKLTQNYVKYLWNNGDITPTLKVHGGGDFNVYVTDANGCTDSANFRINEHLIPIADAGADMEVFAGTTVRLDATRSVGGNSYLWSPAQYLDNYLISQPDATVNQTTTFLLTYYSAEFGCVGYDSVVLRIKECAPLVVPNAFTPNADGLSDYFMIMNPNDYYRLVHLQIYNRWGEMLFSTNNKDALGWDGTFQNIPQEMGTYLYSIKAECGGGKVIDIKGDVTLIR